MSLKIKKFQNNDNTNGWSKILAPRVPKPSLAGTITADWLVIGAGFAGLAAARRLAENRPNDHIALIDSGSAGENASGRNSGFAIDLPHVVGSNMEELKHAHGYMRIARAGIGFNEALVNKFQIDCDWGRQGKYQVAASERGTKALLLPFKETLDALDEPYQWLDGDEIKKIVGTSHFKAAVYTPGCVLMNPAALCRGLADTLPENVTLYENSPVTEIDYANGVRITTAKGSIQAAKIILAANGLAGQFGFYKGKLLPLAAHGSISRPLSEQERIDLGCEPDWGVTPVNAFAGITIRYTRDYRLLIRQNINYNPGMNCTDADRVNIQKHHQKLLQARFPMLPDLSIEHTWTGYLALSGNGSPGFGQASPTVYTAVCQNAIGASKGTTSGMLAADMACGQDNSLIADMLDLGQPNRLPPQPFLGIGVRARFAWELMTNRDER